MPDTLHMRPTAYPDRKTATAAAFLLIAKAAEGWGFTLESGGSMAHICGKAGTWKAYAEWPDCQQPVDIQVQGTWQDDGWKLGEPTYDKAFE